MTDVFLKTSDRSAVRAQQVNHRFHFTGRIECKKLNSPEPVKKKKKTLPPVGTIGHSIGIMTQLAECANHQRLSVSYGFERCVNNVATSQLNIMFKRSQTSATRRYSTAVMDDVTTANDGYKCPSDRIVARAALPATAFFALLMSTLPPVASDNRARQSIR